MESWVKFPNVAVAKVAEAILQVAQPKARAQ